MLASVIHNAQSFKNTQILVFFTDEAHEVFHLLQNIRFLIHYGLSWRSFLSRSCILRLPV